MHYPHGQRRCPRGNSRLLHYTVLKSGNPWSHVSKLPHNLVIDVVNDLPDANMLSATATSRSSLAKEIYRRYCDSGPGRNTVQLRPFLQHPELPAERRPGRPDLDQGRAVLHQPGAGNLRPPTWCQSQTAVRSGGEWVQFTRQARTARVDCRIPEQLPQPHLRSIHTYLQY